MYFLDFLFIKEIMKSSKRWSVELDDKEGASGVVWDVCFSPDGSQVVAAGNKLVVYSSADGSIVQKLKGHKDVVHCVAYATDGKKFASGSADKTVIIWSNTLEALLKFSHVDSIQCLAFNPVTHSLLSCAVSDFGFWRADVKSIDKIKVPARICSCSWTSDGSFFALGYANGVISIRNKNGDEKKRIDRPGLPPTPIWSVDICSFKDESYNILAVADWSQRLSFYHLNGEPGGRERQLGFDPGFLTWFPGGDYLLCGGSNGQVLLYSKEGIKLSLIADTKSWVWKSRVSADGQLVAIACQDGTVSVYQVLSSVVHAIYRDRYMYRQNMTDVIVHHLVTNHKVKVKLRDLVKKVALFKNRMAVQLPERIIVYELLTDDPKDMQYHVKEKINLKVDCSLLVVTSANILLCQEKKLICYNLKGVKEREWTMEAQIRYLKVIGGLPGREGLVVGLKNGQVWKVFLDNQFPISIASISGSVRCVDLSMTRRKLAIVDETEACSVYDVNTKELLFTELNVSSIAWNAQFEDMLCYSGHGLIGIKAANFPTNRQRFSGFVVGFMGSKVFCLFSNNSMIAIDIPQSLAMYQFLEKNRFNDAYRVACLGVTDGDWKFLAETALEHAKFDIAKKAYIRLRDPKYLDLMYTIQERSERGESNAAVFLGDSLAYQGRFPDAAKSYRRAGKEHLAFRMYTDLKMFDLAKEFLSNDDAENRRQLLSKQADWARNVNDPRAAADMYIAAGEYIKAIDIIGENGWTDRLIDLVRRLNKADTESLVRCGHYLRKLGQFAFAAECYNKMGDVNGLISVCVESKNWEEAVDLAKRYPEHKMAIYEPYAKHLIERGEFEEAQQAFHEGGLAAAAIRLLEQLTENAVCECRFDDAAFYYWKLSMQCAEIAQRDAQQRTDMFEKYLTYQSYADMFYAYHPIYKYTEEPFTALTPQQLFYRSHYLFHALIRENPPGISKTLVLITLARFSNELGCFKLANFCYERLQHLVVPAKFRSQVQLQSLFMKAKQFKDKEDMQPLCYRCSNHSPLLSNQPNMCSTCQNHFFYSFDTFEVLPLVNFELEPGISHEEAMTMVEAGQSTANNAKDNNQESRGGSNRGGGKGQGGGGHAKEGRVGPRGESLMIGDGDRPSFDDGNGDNDDLDLFTKNLMQVDFSEPSMNNNSVKTVVVGRDILRSLSVADVIVLRQPEPLPPKYLKNMLPSIRIIKCPQCLRLFNLEDYEKLTRELGKCPFCRRHVE